MSRNVRDIDRGWNAIKRESARAHKLEVAVGLLTGTKAATDGASIAEYGAYNEYGTKHIPARPFMAPSFERNVRAIGQDFDTEGAKLVRGRITANQALTVIGMKHAQRVQNTITGPDIPPPLADSTVARKKGSTKTLVDTGAMVNAVQISIRPRGTVV